MINADPNYLMTLIVIGLVTVFICGFQWGKFLTKRKQPKIEIVT